MWHKGFAPTERVVKIEFQVPEVGISGIQLCSVSSCLFKTNLAAFYGSGPGLHVGSGLGRRRLAQLVDILAKRERRWVSSAVAGQLALWRWLAGTLLICYFMLLLCIFKEDSSKGRRKISFEHCWRGYVIVFSKSSLSFQLPSFLFSLQFSHWLTLRCVCAAEASPLWPYFLFLFSQY